MLWKVTEHLSIAAMILGISVKLVLHVKGKYELNSSDVIMADAIDYFIAGGNLTKDKLLKARSKAIWERATSKAWDCI